MTELYISDVDGVLLDMPKGWVAACEREGWRLPEGFNLRRYSSGWAGLWWPERSMEEREHRLEAAERVQRLTDQGLYEYLDPVEGAVEEVTRLIGLGGMFVACTSRPSRHHDATVAALTRHFPAIMDQTLPPGLEPVTYTGAWDAYRPGDDARGPFGSDKVEAMRRIESLAGTSAKRAFEDEVRPARAAAAAGFPTILIGDYDDRDPSMAGPNLFIAPSWAAAREYLDVPEER
jgi:hypothetical protein